MTRAPRGFALAVALAALVVLAALASLAQLSANAATRESAALRSEVQQRLTRAALHARLTARLNARLTTVARGVLVAQATPLGGPDTVLSVQPLAWPWHRATVSAAGTMLVAEAVRGTVPAAPWCAPGVYGTWRSVANALLSASLSASRSASLSSLPASAPGCTDSLVASSLSDIDAFTVALDTDLLLGPVPDTLVVGASDVVPHVHRARMVVEIASGRTVLGLVVAPVVRVGDVATVRGTLVARDSLFAGVGAMLIADESTVRAALTDAAALHPVGRRGLLLPP